MGPILEGLADADAGKIAPGGLDAPMIALQQNTLGVAGTVKSQTARGLGAAKDASAQSAILLFSDGIANGDDPGAKPVFDLDAVSLLDTARRLRDDGCYRSGRKVSGRPRLLLGAVEAPLRLPAGPGWQTVSTAPFSLVGGGRRVRERVSSELCLPSGPDLAGGVRQEIAGDLLADELIEGQVAVVRVHHVISIAPGIRVGHVVLRAVRVGVVGRVAGETADLPGGVDPQVHAAVVAYPERAIGVQVVSLERRLRFHESPRAVATASSEQVRRPIYREALDQWRHFEPWLGPLKAALGDLAPR